MTPPRAVPLLIAAHFASAVPAAAQPNAGGAPAERAGPEAFVHEVWTVHDGLPVNSINRVLQGPDGYIWLATWDGLVRFDGVRFRVFNTGNTEALPSNRIVELDAAPDGSLWLRTEQNHLVRKRAGTFTHFGEAQGLRDGTAQVIHVDARGQIWVGTDHGVYRLDGERFAQVAPEAIRVQVDAVLHDAAGTVWVGTRHDGLYRVVDGAITQFTTANGLASNWVSALVAAPSGAVWIGTNAGVQRYSNGRVVHVPGPSGDPIPQHVLFLEAAPADETVWVAAEEGVYAARGERLHPAGLAPGQAPQPRVRFDARGEAWYALGDRLYHDGRLVFEVPRLNPAERRSSVQIRDFVWDHEGSLWIATQVAGLFRLKSSFFQVYSAAEGLADHNVASVLQDRSGAIWVGTHGGGLSHLDGGRVTNYTPRQGYPGHILALLQTRDGYLWVGTYAAGVLRCRLPAMACTAPQSEQFDGDVGVRALYEDEAGHVWVGSALGLFRIVKGARELLPAAGVGQANVVRVFLEARDGTLWMGTSGSGVLAYRGGRFTRITAADGLPSNLIRALHEDSRGRLWVGTEGRGLARLTLGESADGAVSVVAAKVIRQRDGLFDEVIHQILEDDFGRFWMSTNRGIFWVSQAELDGFADGRIARVHSTAYLERHGLRNREANGGTHPAGLRDRDGRLWFPTQDGVVVVDPASIRRNTVAPPVVIEQVATRQRQLHPGAGLLVLRAGERDFEVDYTALSFVAPENVQFRYRLEGLSTEWTEAGNRRTAFYTNVPPGTYTFRVIASNDDGVWNETGASLELRVTPYFRETRAAMALLVLGLVALGNAGVRWRLRLMRRRERELTELVGTRTAELQQREVQLEQQNAQLLSQADQLTELDRAKSRLFANLSHEFRTPLTLIVGPLRGLLEGRYGALEREAREQGEMMLRNAQRLLRLINQILDLAKLQAGGLALDRRAHDLVGFTRTVTLAFTPLAERRGIVLRFRSAVPELTLAFDAEQLEKVLLNLLSNALKFTEAGGRVEVSVAVRDGAVAIAVRDTGQGIADEQLPRVFERFHQVDGSATRRHEGTGIGLALARELVELHGGEIRAVSALGAGSTFTVRLPLDGVTPAATAGTEAAPPDERLAFAMEVYEAGTAGETEPRDPARDRTTVLIVDDNPDVRAYVRSVLAASYRVLAAPDGQAGLELARSALPDLIVADVMMPGLDGLALARELRGDPMTDAVPIVLLTARATPDDQVAGLGSGADAYLVKPFEPAVLEAQVANLLAQRRHLRERFRAGDAAPPSSAATDAAASALDRRLRPLVEAHLTDPDFGPDALADLAGLSYRQLYRALRRELGTTPSRFIRTVRVECAAELLRQGAGSVTEVAYSVGFESLSYFSRAFRERFAASPSEHIASPAASPPV